MIYRANVPGCMAMCLPIHYEQQNQSRKVGGGNVGFLLEAEEDHDHYQARDDVVTLSGKQIKTSKEENIPSGAENRCLLFKFVQNSIMKSVNIRHILCPRDERSLVLNNDF